MAVEEIHLNDIGTVFELTVYEGDVIVDVSSAVSLNIYFRKPDGTTVLTKSAAFTTDGTDGKIRYVTVDGDLDTTGGWKIQGRVELPTGRWSTDVQSFKVYSNLV